MSCINWFSFFVRVSHDYGGEDYFEDYYSEVGGAEDVDLQYNDSPEDNVVISPNGGSISFLLIILNIKLIVKLIKFGTGREKKKGKKKFPF